MGRCDTAGGDMRRAPPTSPAAAHDRKIRGRRERQEARREHLFSFAGSHDVWSSALERKVSRPAFSVTHVVTPGPGGHNTFFYLVRLSLCAALLTPAYGSPLEQFDRRCPDRTTAPFLASVLDRRPIP